MYQIDFQKPVHVHFIGIGGISMSGLAEILLQKGFVVSGSDIDRSDVTKHLEELGIKVNCPQSSENISKDIDVVVYTAAIHPDNPEFLKAMEDSIPLLTRAELLGEIMRNYKTAINISGTHGKTTTTSMISRILIEAGMDPTVTVGGMVSDIGGNIRVGSSDLFVAEACEYTNSFLSFFPTIEIILNVEEDHMDFFKDLEDIRRSFRKFTRKLPDDGLLILNKDITHYEYFIEGLSCPVVTFGHDKDADYTANFIRFDRFAHPSFHVYGKGKDLGEFTLSVAGQHNIYNSLSAIAATLSLGVDIEDIRRGLSLFKGADRRFQKKGVYKGCTIIDDYAHHPQEIAATLETARRLPHRKLWVLFQPHTYSRTAAFMDDFAGALANADEVVLADIYAAREKNTLGISSGDLKGHMLSQNTRVHYIPDFPSIVEFMSTRLGEGDLFITMGAGDVYKVGDALLKL